jgi:Putative transmembrane protein (Alph_Pro_TM)
MPSPKPRVWVPAVIPLLILSGFLTGSAVYGRTSPPGIDVVQPKTIRIGSFFSGGRVTVRGVVPAGDQVALRILGRLDRLVLMKKGRVGGLWMNVGQITFQNIPNIYLLWTSAPWSSLGTAASLQSWKLDYLSLLAGALPHKDPEEEARLLREMVKLKEEDQLYRITEGAVQIKPLEPGTWDQVDAVLSLPSKIEPGFYTLEMIAFKDGQGRLIHSSTLEVKLAGFPALISDLANHQGLGYGVLAVIIATLSGLVIGIVFSAKGGH